MTTHYIHSGSIVRPMKDYLPPPVTTELAADTYVVCADKQGMFLERVDSFTLPPKLYGLTTGQSERILRTFLSRPATTGVLLAGEKGSGKSLLAKTISVEAAKLGIPTLLVNAPFTGDMFSTFLQSITQPVVVLFDEFEKVYDPEAQDSILTLLDGVFPTQKLFLLTCNERASINAYMMNRPGRIFYYLDFKGLDRQFIREYCEDNLVAQHRIEEVVRISSVFGSFNFDMLKALVQEMNRYDESALKALEWLNVRPEFDRASTEYTTSLYLNGEPVATDKTTMARPLVSQTGVNVYLSNHDEHGKRYPLRPEQYDPTTGWYEYESYGFNPEHITKMTDTEVVYERDNLRLVMRVKPTTPYSWRDHISGL